MAHYVVAFHETDLKFNEIIKDLRSTKYPTDKAFVDKFNLCNCYDYSLPAIRELRFVEIDIPEPSDKSFEDKIKTLGLRPFKPPSFFKWFLKWLIKIVYKKDVDVIIDSGETTHRLNHRSFILFKSHDNPPGKDNVIKCEKCKRNMPMDWV